MKWEMETGSFACLTLGAGGWLSNLIIYLIEEYNIKSIDATLIANVVSGCLSIFPVVGAVVADSFFGSFAVIVVSSCVSLLVIFLVYLLLISMQFFSFLSTFYWIGG